MVQAQEVVHLNLQKKYRMKYEIITFRDKEYYLVPVKAEKEKKVAIIAGHTITNKGDWSNLFEDYEHSYWNQFIKNYFPDWIDSFEHIPNATYTDRQKAMAELTKDYDLVIELHWNAYDYDKDGIDDANGVECYTWVGNEKMLEVGKHYCNLMNDSFGLKIRGSKQISGGNGAGFLYYTKGDAILLEPFFADNVNDVAKFDRQEYANIILEMIDKYYE